MAPTTTPMGSGGLETGPDVDRVAGEEALARARGHVEAHEGLAGVDADAHLDGAAGDRRQSLDGLDELEPRANRTLGIVLVRRRHAEDGDHGVADELLDRAPVVLDDIARHSVVTAQQGVDVLRVGVLAERRRSDQVAEQGGHDLALLGVGGGGGERGAALAAELEAVGKLGVAGGAGQHGRAPSWARRRGSPSVGEQVTAPPRALIAGTQMSVGPGERLRRL